MNNILVDIIKCSKEGKNDCMVLSFLFSSSSHDAFFIMKCYSISCEKIMPAKKVNNSSKTSTKKTYKETPAQNRDKYKDIVKKLIPRTPIFVWPDDKYPYYVRFIQRMYKGPIVNIILCKTLRKAKVYVKRLEKHNSLYNQSYYTYITTGLTENLTVPTGRFIADYDSDYRDEEYTKYITTSIRRRKK